MAKRPIFIAKDKYLFIQRKQLNLNILQDFLQAKNKNQLIHFTIRIKNKEEEMFLKFQQRERISFE